MSTKSSQLTLKASRKMGQPITENLHYAMVELRAFEALDDLIKRAPTAARLVHQLIRRMQPGSAGVIVCSRQTMSELIGASMPTIDRALKLLTEEGWVQRIKIGGAHALAINSRIAWIGSRGQIQHAVFEATVIASRTEQDAIALEPPPLRQMPIMRAGEIALATGPGSDPPSQPALENIEPAAAIVGDAAERAELEKRGQLRIDVDPDQDPIEKEIIDLTFKLGQKKRAQKLRSKNA